MASRHYAFSLLLLAASWDRFRFTSALAFATSRLGRASNDNTSAKPSSSCRQLKMGYMKHVETITMSIISPRHQRRKLLRQLFSAINDESILTDDEDEYSNESTANNPLKSAGLSFVSASSKSLGMLFYNIGGMDHKEVQALLLEAGTRLVSAGEAWYDDWNDVRDSMEMASRAFYDISDVFGSANIDESMPLGTLFEKIGRELEDVSDISGCCAVGPPCSAPNLLAVEENLIEVSRILKKNSVASTDEHMMSTLFREVAELFGEMARRYEDVDMDGQKSEVTL